MADNTEDGRTNDRSTTSTDIEQSAVAAAYKILGQLTDGSGVGVLGQNDAGSGTPIGVQGAVPNATGSGYGLYTDHDAKVGQTLELAAMRGSIFGNQTVDTLTGAGLSVVSQALAIGNGAITASMLAQNGASDGQTFVWDAGTSQWTTSSYCRL
jgi:hypothetical protein